MSTFRTIAGRVTALVAALALLAVSLATGLIALREYHHQENIVQLQASALINNQPGLQVDLYFEDRQPIRETLRSLLQVSPAVKRVRVFDAVGRVISEADRELITTDSTPDLGTLRQGLSPTDEGEVALDGGSVPEHLKMLEFVTLGEQRHVLTFPILSTVNPIDRTLSREQFALALVNSDTASSLHVAGYVALTTSSTVLWSQTLPIVFQAIGLGVLLVAGFCIIARRASRGITAPLATLAKQADAIASGKQMETLRVDSGGEVAEIANLFNGIFGDMQDETRRTNTDRKMLSLAVDQRTQELNQNQQQLADAERLVTETRHQLHHLANFDTLTSLPNRRLFLEQLTLLLRLAARNNQTVGLLLVDIDNFKRINESLGAAGGDLLLRQIAKRLATCVRDSDVLHRRSQKESRILDLSRMGGDEFTVVLNQVDDAESAKQVAQRLSQTVSEPYQIGEQEVVISSSIGIALAPQHAQDPEDLLRKADTAMMDAKRAGRNRITVFDESMLDDSIHRLRLENELRKAITDEQLVLHYQPQVHAHTGKVTGVEALVRWQHPEKGMIPPFQWIPVAEELGLIEQVGAWVLRTACRTAAELQNSGMDLPRVSVNVSALQLNPSFVDLVKTTLGDTALPPESLKLELTEGIMINSHEPTIQLVQQLRDTGVQLSIDDFGTGYSSLSYLTRLPLNELKIDRSFVQGLTRGQENEELVRAIIAMARSLGLDVVVEGVEHVEELQFFREQQVDVIQGYLFSSPVPEERLRDMLEPEYFRSHLSTLESNSQDTDASGVNGNPAQTIETDSLELKQA